MIEKPVTVCVEETTFSDCGTYRYVLRRHNLDGNRNICFVMLNPSTADATLDDPTTRRAMDFASRINCGEYMAVNLFAMRSPNPKDLRLIDDPVGPLNDEYLLAAADWADAIIVAWGNGGAYKNRDLAVRHLLRHKFLHCLGLTGGGYPKFPLYLKKNTKLEVYDNAS